MNAMPCMVIEKVVKKKESYRSHGLKLI